MILCWGSPSSLENTVLDICSWNRELKIISFVTVCYHYFFLQCLKCTKSPFDVHKISTNQHSKFIDIYWCHMHLLDITYVSWLTNTNQILFIIFLNMCEKYNYIITEWIRCLCFRCRKCIEYDFLYISIILNLYSWIPFHDNSIQKFMWKTEQVHTSVYQYNLNEWKVTLVLRYTGNSVTMHISTQT